MSDNRRKEIYFNWPTLVGGELDYIRQTVDGAHTASGGEFTLNCARLLKRLLGSHDVHMTTSCTDALEMAAILLDLEPGDEVVVPSFSFVSTANAFALRGARPVFADIRPDTLNLDERAVESRIGPRTRALLVVHYAGVGAEMDVLRQIAEARGLQLIEDNAHGLFGRYRGRYLGTFGSMATLSFHETKNFTCGEGGALVVNDPALADRAEIVRDKGTNRQQLFRGEVDKYTWVDLGSSFGLSDILAAFLFAQLEARESILAHRRAIWERYDEALRGTLETHEVGLPHVPAHCEQGYHMYYLLLPSLEQRQRFIAHLQKQAISAVFHYTPLHLSGMGRRLGGRPGDCPVTERVSDTLVRLPFHSRLTEDDQARVIEAARGFFTGRG